MRNAVIAVVLVLGIAACAGIFYLVRPAKPNDFPPKPEPPLVATAKRSATEAPAAPPSAPAEDAETHIAEKDDMSEGTDESEMEGEGEDYEPKWIKVYGTVTDAATGQPVAGARLFDESYKNTVQFSVDEDYLDDETVAVSGMAKEDLLRALKEGKPLTDAAQKALSVVCTESDAAGAFSVTMDALMEESLLCRAKGYAVASRSVTEDSPESLRIDFQLRPDAKISGKVTNAADGKGVEDVTVSAIPEEANAAPIWERMNEDEGITGKTGADGNFTIDGLPAGAYTVVVDDREHGWLFDQKRLVNVTVTEGQEKAGVALTVTEGGKIEGTIANERGEPVEQAYVSATPDKSVIEKFTDQEMWRDMPPSYSDEDGHYLVVGLHAGKNIVTVHHDDYASASATLQVEEGKPAAVRQDFKLVVGVSVSGIAKYEDGSPAVEESLYLRKPGEGASEFDPQAWGDFAFVEQQDGAFKFEHVLPGEYEIVSDASMMPGTEAANASPKVPVKVDGKNDVTGLEITLKKREEKSGDGDAITGTVQTPDGKPVEGAEVRGIPADTAQFGFEAGTSHTTTASDGTFRVESSRSTNHTVVAQTDTGEASQADVKPGDDITLTLGPVTSVSGEVVDSQGEPVAGCKVELVEPDTGKSESMAKMMSRMMEPLMGGGKASQTTDDFGQFTFKHARPGAFVVEAKSAGKGFGASGTLTVTQGVETKNIRVVLDAGVAFSGLVVDGSGAPVAGANVSLVESHGGPMESYLMNLPMGMGAKPEAAATSDAQGAFTMSGLKKGTYVLSAKHADFAPFVAKDVDVSGSQGSPYRIAMGKGGSAHGQYLVDGKPKANVMVQLMGASGMQMATTDSEGRFEVKGLAAGTYMVMPMDFGAMREGAGGSPSFKFKSVTVTEGGEIEIPFGQGVKVSGAVPADMLGKMTIVYLMRPGAPELPTMTPGMPSMEPAFEMMQYMAGFGMVGADGSFSVDGVDPGQYELRVYASNFNMSDIKPEEFMNLSLEEMQAQSQQYQPKEVSRQNVTVGTEPMEVQVTPAEPKP